MIGELECPWCRYRWMPRVAKPKECPSCKQNLTRMERSKRSRAAREGQIVPKRFSIPISASQTDPVDLLISNSQAVVHRSVAVPSADITDLPEAQLHAMRLSSHSLKDDKATQELIRRMVARGMGSRAIAKALGIAKSSVNNWRR